MAGDRTKSKVVIVSGPSGAGKSTVVRELLAKCPVPIVLSVSATTRLPRHGEVNGVNYHFLSTEEFAKRRENGDFLECKEVYGRDWYGTLHSEVTTGLAAGKWVLLEIDVEGAIAVLETMPDAVTIFLHPGSLAETQRRLENRRTESKAAIERRMEVARQELTLKHKYKYEVINDRVDRAVEEICDILQRSGD